MTTIPSQAPGDVVRWVCGHRISVRWPQRLCHFPAVGGPASGGPEHCVRHLEPDDRTRLRLTLEPGGDIDALLREGDLSWNDPASWTWDIPGDPVKDLNAAHRAEGEARKALWVNRLLGEQSTARCRIEMALSFWQDGCCAVCSIRPARLVTDHCHFSGLVRGLLCHSCNVKEGNWHHDSEAIAGYRRRPPAALLGFRLRYFDRVNGYAEPLTEPHPESVFPWWEHLVSPWL